MSFKGDLSTIGLAEVFQMISMSQKEGTLVVQDADSRKAIYFGSTGVKLVSIGKRKGLRLGDILVRAGKISEDSLSEALENSKIQRRMLGEVLVESGYVTEAEIQQIVREQIEEEIYDLFLWKRANFEFIEGPASDTLKDPDAPVTKLSFDVNGLLLEAVRRADEWTVINQKLPSVDSIFTWTGPQARPEEDEMSTDSAKRVYRFVDGQTAVAEIVENAGVPKFEACKVLTDLSDRSRIRLLDVPEIMELAQKRVGNGQRERGIKLYVAAAVQAPHDAKVAATVSRVLEMEGLEREAAVHHLRASKLFLEQGDLDRAFDHVRKAAELAPEDQEVKLGLFEVNAAAGNLNEGKRLAAELANQALMGGDFAKTRMLCDRILRVDPEDIDFRVLRAKVLHRTHQKKELEEDLQFIRAKMPGDQRRADEINLALREVIVRTPTTRATTPAAPGKAVLPRKNKKRKGALVGVGVVLGGVLLLGGKYELDAAREFKEARGRAWELMEKSEFDRARAQVESFLAGFHRLSLFQRESAENLRREIDARTAGIKVHRSEEEAKSRAALLSRMSALDASMTDDRNINPELALEKARELKRLADEASEADFSRRATETIASLERTLKEAAQLQTTADGLERDGKYRESAQVVERLVREYANTRSARAATYPLEIVTRPPGVKVTSVRAGVFVGETGTQGVIYRMKDGEVVRFLFEKPGYGSLELAVKDKTMGRLYVDLTDKRERWIMPLGFEVSGEPAVEGQMVFVAGGSRVYALRPSTQRLLWTETLEGTVVGSPRAANGLIYVASSGKSLLAIDPRQPDKRVAWKVILSDRPTCGPGFSSDGTQIHLVTADRQLYAIKAKTGELVWKKPVPAEVVVEPVGVGGVLAVPCEDGTIVGLKAESPEELWRVRGEAGFLAAGSSGSYVYFTGADQTVHAIDTRSGSRAWKRLLSTGLTGRPARIGNLVCIAARDGRVFFLDASTGDTLSQFEAGAPVPGGLTAFGTMLLFGSEDQSFMALDATRGTPVWKFKSKEKIRSAAVVSEGFVYFCGEATLFAIELN
jgi:outer membrane protein assembly factor BamB